MQFVIYLFICSFGQIFPPPSVANSSGICTCRAGCLLHFGKDFAVSRLSSSLQCAWVAGSQYYLTVSGWNALLPWITYYWRGVFSEVWKIFRHLILWLLLQCTWTANPLLFSWKISKIYFWHLYFLQMVNTIAVTGLTSALSQLTALPLLSAGGGWARTWIGQDTWLESCSWRAKSSAKVTNSPAISCISSAFQHLSLSSSWAKFSHMQIPQKAQKLEGFN